jgi:membrane protein
MKYDQKQNPLWLGILFGTAVYGSIVLAILSIINISIRVVLIIPLCIMFVFVLILQTRNISSAKKEEDVDYCLKTYFIYKYITMPIELTFAGIIGTIIFAIFGIIIHWPEDRLVATLLVFIITLIISSIITFIVTIVPYSLIVFAVIGLPCFISIEYVLGITQKNTEYLLRKERYIFYCR